jgi:hypothetical protein
MLDELVGEDKKVQRKVVDIELLVGEGPDVIVRRKRERERERERADQDESHTHTVPISRPPEARWRTLQ